MAPALDNDNGNRTIHNIFLISINFTLGTRLALIVNINGVDVEGLLDGGSQICLMSAEIARRCKVKNRKDGHRLRAAFGQEIKAVKLEDLRYVFNGRRGILEAYAAEDASNNLLLGSDFLRDNGFTLDYGKGQIAAEYKGNRIVIRRDGKASVIQCWSKSRRPVVRAEEGVSAMARGEGRSLPAKEKSDKTEKSLCAQQKLKSADEVKEIFRESIRDPTQLHSIFNIHRTNEIKRGEEKSGDRYSAEQYVNFEDRNDYISQFAIDHLRGKEYSIVSDMMWEFKDRISRDDYDVGVVPNMEVEINTIEGFEHKFRHQGIRTYSVEQKRTIDDWKRHLMDRGMVEESNSPIACPILVVRRPDRKLRVVVDYKPLNEFIIQPDAPYVSMKDSFDTFKGKHIFSTIDLTMAFYSIPIKKNDRWKSAIRTHDSLIQMTRCAMGMANSPKQMTKLAFKVVRGCNEYMTSYVDDIATSSATFEEHVRHVRKMFERLREFNLKVKAKKCQLFQSSIKFLGHIVSERGLEIPYERIKAIMEIPIPRNVRQVRRIIGIANFNRDFVESIDLYLGPLHDLTKKDVKFNWTAHHTECFQLIKKKLSSRPCLAFPEEEATKVIQSDASDNSVGGLIGQMNGKSLQVIAYFNKRLSKSERKWSACERELFAVMVATRRFYKLLIDRPFWIYTDHKPLTVLNTHKIPKNQRLYRWGVELSMFNFKIRYFKGKDNIIADSISRLEYAVNNSDDKTIDEIASEDIVRALDDEKEEEPTERVCPYDESELKFVLNIDVTEEDQIAELDNNIEKYQNEDTMCTAYKAVILGRNKEFPEILKKFKVYDNVLYKKKRRNQRNPNQLQVVIPQKLVPKLLEVYHDGRDSGAHQGVNKTEQKIADRYYFQNSRQYIRAHIQRCERCQLTREPNKRPYGAPRVIGAPEQPFHTINMDLCGPFRKSAKGNKYFIVAVDRLTRYVTAKAVPNKRAQNYIDFLTEISNLHSTPSKLITDRDAAFEDKTFKKFIDGMAIEHRKTATYFAASDGLSEINNRKILNGLRRYCNHEYKYWDIDLQSVVKSINRSINITVGWSPHFLLFGYDPINAFERQLKVRLLKEYPDITDNTTNETNSDLTVEAAREEARKRIIEAETKWAAFRATKLTPSPFKVGDVVLCLDKSLDPTNPGSRKLKELRTGPFIVVKQVSEGTYHILRVKRLTKKHKKLFVVNARMLVPYFGPKPAMYDKLMDRAKNGEYEMRRPDNTEIWDIENVRKWNRIMRREDTSADHLPIMTSESESDGDEELQEPQLSDNEEDLQLSTPNGMSTQLSQISLLQRNENNSQNTPNNTQNTENNTQSSEIRRIYNTSDSSGSFIGFTPSQGLTTTPNIEEDPISDQLLEQNTGGILQSMTFTNSTHNNSNPVNSNNNTNRSDNYRSTQPETTCSDIRRSSRLKKKPNPFGYTSNTQQ